MDSRTEGSTAQARPGKAASKRGNGGTDGGSVVDVGLPKPAAKPEPRQASAPIVHGKVVKGLWLHFVGGPAHLIAPGDGTFEFERLYYADGAYTAKAGYVNKLGSQLILGADLNNERLLLEFTDYFLTVPANRISGNWSK